MNQPSRFEFNHLKDGEPKLTVTEDTKIPDAATFTINKEDHTLANMLRAQLLELPYVIFSGYKVPHPLEPVVVLKVQTDGSFTPVEAVQTACSALVSNLGKMKVEFSKEILKAKGRDEEFTGMGMEDGGNYNSNGAEAWYDESSSRLLQNSKGEILPVTTFDFQPGLAIVFVSTLASITPASALLQPSRPTTATTQNLPFLSYGTTTNFSINPFSIPHPSSILPSPLLPSINSIPFQLLPTFSKHSHLNKKGSNLKANVRIKCFNQNQNESKWIEFYCHKEVLGLSSSFFECILNGGWKETEDIINKKKEKDKKLQLEKKDVATKIDSLNLSGVVEDSIQPGVDKESNDIVADTLEREGEISSTPTLIIPNPIIEIKKEQQQKDIDANSITNSYMSSIIEEDDEASDDDEEEEGIVCKLKLKEESAASFQDLLCFIYPKLELLISWNNVGDQLKMSSKFDLPALRNVCIAFLLPSAAGNPIMGMHIAEEHGIPELYKESSRYLLDAFPNWQTAELSVLSPATLLKLERRRSYYLERVLKLSQIQISRDYTCCESCPDIKTCTKLVDEKWKSAWSSVFRFGIPQPSIIYRSLKSLEPSLLSPAIHLPHTACQSHAKLWIADLFDKMFSLGIVPSRNWGALSLNAKNAGGSKYFMYVEME